MTKIFNNKSKFRRGDTVAFVVGQHRPKIIEGIVAGFPEPHLIKVSYNKPSPRGGFYEASKFVHPSQLKKINRKQFNQIKNYNKKLVEN